MNKTFKNHKYNKIRKKRKISKKYTGGVKNKKNKSPGAIAQKLRMQQARKNPPPPPSIPSNLDTSKKRHLFAQTEAEAEKKLKQKGREAAKAAINNQKATKIQSAIRGKLARSRKAKQEVKATKIQSAIRGKLARNRKAQPQENLTSPSPSPPTRLPFEPFEIESDKSSLKPSISISKPSTNDNDRKFPGDTTTIQGSSPAKKLRKAITKRIGQLTETLNKTRKNATGKIEDLKNRYTDYQTTTMQKKEKCIDAINKIINKSTTELNYWNFDTDFYYMIINKVYNEEFDNLNFADCGSNLIGINNIQKCYTQTISQLKPEIKKNLESTTSLDDIEMQQVGGFNDATYFNSIKNLIKYISKILGKNLAKSEYENIVTKLSPVTTSEINPDKSGFTIPTMPKVSMPTMPKVSMPTMPKVSMPNMPKVSMPTMPKVSMPNMPKVSMPTMPKVSIPNMPKVSMPNMPDINIISKLPNLKGMLSPYSIPSNCQSSLLQNILVTNSQLYDSSELKYKAPFQFNEEFINLIRQNSTTNKLLNLQLDELSDCQKLVNSYKNLIQSIQFLETVVIPLSSIESKPSEGSSIPSTSDEVSISSDSDSEQKGGYIFNKNPSSNPYTRVKNNTKLLINEIIKLSNQSYDKGQESNILGYLNQKESEWNSKQIKTEIKTEIAGLTQEDRELLNKISKNYYKLSGNYGDILASIKTLPDTIEQQILKKLSMNELERQNLEDKIKKQIEDQDDQESGSQIQNLKNEKEILEKILEKYRQYGYIGLNPTDGDDTVKVNLPDSCGNIIPTNDSIKGFLYGMTTYKVDNPKKYNYYLHEFIKNQETANPNVPKLPSVLGGANDSLLNIMGDKICLTNALNILLQKEAFSVNQQIAASNNTSEYFVLPETGELTKSPTLPIYVDKVKNILELIGVNNDPLNSNECSLDNTSQQKYLEFLLGLYGFKYEIIGTSIEMKSGAPDTNLPPVTVPQNPSAQTSFPAPNYQPITPSPPSASLPLPSDSMLSSSPISTSTTLSSSLTSSSIGEKTSSNTNSIINSIFGINGGKINTTKEIPNTITPGFILLTKLGDKTNYIILTNDGYRPESSVENTNSAVNNNHDFRLVPDNNLACQSGNCYTNHKINFQYIKPTTFNSPNELRSFINEQLTNDSKELIPKIEKVIFIYNPNYNIADSEKREIINLYKDNRLFNETKLTDIQQDHSTVTPSIEDEDLKKEKTDSEKKAKIVEIKVLEEKLSVNNVQINDLEKKIIEIDQKVTKIQTEINNDTTLEISNTAILIEDLENKNKRLQMLVDKKLPYDKAKQGVSYKIKSEESYSNKIDENENKITELKQKINTFTSASYKSNEFKKQLKEQNLDPESDKRQLIIQITNLRNENDKIENKIQTLEGELLSKGGSKNKNKSKKREKKYSKSKNIFSRKKYKIIKNNKKNNNKNNKKNNNKNISKKIKKHKPKSIKRGGYGPGDLKIVTPQITTTDALKSLLNNKHMDGNKYLLTIPEIQKLLKK